MSIIEPTHPPKPKQKYPDRDEIGREQKTCFHCGERIVRSRMYRKVWVHPDMGYTTFCVKPTEARPV